tara:strand:+ start:233 stop:442 length:210 start_codon:yes stop_codon:yes gene_type:complete
MPNVGSIGWAYVSGSTSIDVNYNASTLSEDTIIPEGYLSVIYGPFTIGSGVTFRIKADAKVKIKDFDDV